MNIATRLALLAALALAGCSSYRLSEPLSPASPFQDPPRDRAQICVFRTSVLAQAVTFPVRDNGVLVGATRGPSHFCYLAEPGRHAIIVEADEPEHAQIEARPGGRYYLAQEVDNLFGWVKCRAAWVTEEVARDLAERSAYQVLSGVPGNERLPSEVPHAPAATAGRGR